MNVIVSNKYQSQLNTLQIDVIKSVNGEFTPEEIVEMFANFFFNKMILDVTAIKGYQTATTIQRLAMGIDMSKVILVLDDSDVTGSKEYLSQLISMGIYNFTRNIDNIPFLIDNPNTYKDVAQFQQIGMIANEISKKHESAKFESDNDITTAFTTIIGIKNVTDHAGATTLIYMLKKQLQSNYNVLAIEIDKNDFILFNDKDLISIPANKFEGTIRGANTYDIILVDLNNSGEESSCSDVLYLLEPSTIKLNKMIRKDRRIFDTLKGKKIVLNKSLLDNKDVMDFEYESKSQIFYNIPPLDDKKEKHRVLDDLLTHLGFRRQKGNDLGGERTKILGIFKNKS